MAHGGQLTLRDDPALAARIVASIPASEQAFVTLLGLLRIGVSDDIRTACVTLGARSRLMVNPDFVARMCPTDEALATLVMHELYHVLLGHTRLFARARPLDNVAFDAVINAHLAQRFPAPPRLALFTNTYAPDVLPGALMRPPEGWPHAPNWILPGVLGSLHRRLYTPEGGTWLEVYDALRATLPQIRISLEDLLGSHGLEEDGAPSDAACDDPELRKVIADIVARWPAAQELGGRDAGSAAQDLGIDVSAPPPPLTQAVRAAVLRVAGVLRSQSGGTAAEGQGPAIAPYRDRPAPRETGLELLGETPLFFPSAAQRVRQSFREKVHLYLDVSGSMARQLPMVAGAVLSVRHLLAPQIHAFSTEIADVDAEQLRQGHVESTGGTSIACVTEHMVAHGVQRAVVVTDGAVGDVPEPDAERLLRRKLRMHAVLTRPGHAAFVDQLAGRATLCEPRRHR